MRFSGLAEAIREGFQARVDDKRVQSGIIFNNRNGLRWRDAPAVSGPRKTLYSRKTLMGNCKVKTPFTIIGENRPVMCAIDYQQKVIVMFWWKVLTLGGGPLSSDLLGQGRPAVLELVQEKSSLA